MTFLDILDSVQKWKNCEESFGEKYKIDRNDISGSLAKINDKLFKENPLELFDACVFNFFNTLGLPSCDVNLKCFNFISEYISQSDNLEDAFFFVMKFLERFSKLCEWKMYGMPTCFMGKPVPTEIPEQEIDSSITNINNLPYADFTRIFTHLEALIKISDTNTNRRCDIISALNSACRLNFGSHLQTYKLRMLDRKKQNRVCSFANMIKHLHKNVSPFYWNECALYKYILDHSGYEGYKTLIRTFRKSEKYSSKYKIDKRDIAGSLVKIKQLLIDEKQEDIFDACVYNFFNTLDLPDSELNRECFDFISEYILHSCDLEGAYFFTERFLLKTGVLLNSLTSGNSAAKELTSIADNTAINALLTKDMSIVFDHIIECINADADSDKYLELFESIQNSYFKDKLVVLENSGYNSITKFFTDINTRISDIRECKKYCRKYIRFEQPPEEY